MVYILRIGLHNHRIHLVKHKCQTSLHNIESTNPVELGSLFFLEICLKFAFVVDNEGHVTAELENNILDLPMYRTSLANARVSRFKTS